jgi:hypothetical protein
MEPASSASLHVGQLAMIPVWAASLLVMRAESRTSVNPSVKSRPHREQLCEAGSVVALQRGHVALAVSLGDPSSGSPHDLQKAQPCFIAAEQAGQLCNSLVSLRRSMSVWPHHLQ